MKKDRRKSIQKNIFLFLMLCIIVGWIIFFDMGFNFTPQNSNATNLEEKQKAFPHFFMENFQTTQFNDEGSVQYLFSGTSAKQFQVDPVAPSDADYMDITHPEVIFFQTQEPPWTLKSETGRATHQGDIITLSLNVTANQIINDSTSTSITTDELTLKPRDQFAETEKPVMIDYTRAHYEGLGMEVDFKNKIFSLLSNVKGVHEPPQ